MPGDVARLEVARPHNPESPYLQQWDKTTPGPVIFDGVPCASPSRAWRSGKTSTATTHVGDGDGANGGGDDVWNMLCDIGGKQPWARLGYEALCHRHLNNLRLP